MFLCFESQCGLVDLSNGFEMDKQEEETIRQIHCAAPNF